MNYLSVCSGIEAATVARHTLGWKPAGFAEIEAFPSAVLAHHYPNVCNFGDMTRLADWLDCGFFDPPDILVGGTPCQAFSVAGLRRSLDDARGNLSLVYCQLADAIDTHRADLLLDPAIIVWENVPGVLSTHDNAFGCFLAGLAGEDDPLVPAGKKWPNAGVVYGPKRTVAWRILDAQYFGVAQRRRRVFVVAGARTRFDPAAVLFEFDGVRRDSAPSREAGKGAAGTITGGARKRGGYCYDDVPLTPACGQKGLEVRSGVRYAHYAHDRITDPCGVNPALTGAALASGNLNIITMAHGQGGAEIGYDCGPTLTCNHEAPIASYVAVCATGHKTHALTTRSAAEEDGTGRGIPLVPAICFSAKDHGADALQDLSPTLRAGGHAGSHANAGVMPAVAFDSRQDPVSSEHLFGALGSSSPQAQAVAYAMQVRRLTPRECERLQGFPDDYTRIPWKLGYWPADKHSPEVRTAIAEQCPDGPRYKALGNSMAVPVMAWIGRRIARALA